MNYVKAPWRHKFTHGESMIVDFAKLFEQEAIPPEEVIDTLAEQIRQIATDKDAAMHERKILVLCVVAGAIAVELDGVLPPQP